MEWSEVEKLIRQKVAEQPRGFQARLAETLEVKQPSVAQVLAGRTRIPPDWAETILNLMDLEIVVRPREMV